MKEHKSHVAFSAIYDKATSMAEDPEIMHRRKCQQGTQDVRHTYKALYDSIHDNTKSQIAQRYKSLDSMRFLELLDGRTFPEDASTSLLKTLWQFIWYCAEEIQGNIAK